MATTKITVTTNRAEVAEGRVFISYIGPGLECAFGNDPDDDHFHQIADRTFEYSGDEKVWIRKPSTCSGMTVIATVHTP